MTLLPDPLQMASDPAFGELGRVEKVRLLTMAFNERDQSILEIVRRSLEELVANEVRHFHARVGQYRCVPRERSRARFLGALEAKARAVFAYAYRHARLLDVDGEVHAEAVVGHWRYDVQFLSNPMLSSQLVRLFVAREPCKVRFWHDIGIYELSVRSCCVRADRRL